MSRELSLQNFDDEENLSLAEKVLASAQECGMIVDKTIGVENLREKRFRLANQMRSRRRFIEDCHDKYVSHHAKRGAIKRLVQKHSNTRSDLRRYSK